MASRDDFASALADADVLLGERELGDHVDARIFASTGERAVPARRTWLLAAVVPVVALLLYFAFGTRDEPLPAVPPATVEGWTIREASDELDVHVDEGRVSVVSGTATFEDAAWGTLRNAGALVFARAPEGVRVIDGEATFSVAHDRDWERPKRVVVSHGAIEIVGTRFTVEQDREGGRVTLHEGTIRFVDDEGAVTLAPGEQLRWPREPDKRDRDGANDGGAAPAPTTSASAAHAPPAVSASPSELMRKVEELRSRGRYDEAAELLRNVDEQSGADEATRERLSFERGSLLTYQRKDRARACAHWINHLIQYPHGRYGDDVHRALQYLKCGSKGQNP